jgi:hypothetical protein
MALKAERPHIREIALASALRHRNNMVRIPQRFPAAFPQTPRSQKRPARRVIQFPHVSA